MSKRHHKVASEVRSQILEEALKPGSNIPKIAKAYGISDGTIYRFCREEQKLRKLTTNTALNSKLLDKTKTKHFSRSPSHQFIELSVQDADVVGMNHQGNIEAEITYANTCNTNTKLATTTSSKFSSLQKASLIFDDFSLTIEGNLQIPKILQVIKALEASEEKYSC